MNRRTFAQTLAAAAAAAASPSFALAQAEATAGRQPATSLSVMLWTVFNNLPFEQRLEKIAEAGYSQVELVGEYAHWTEAEFARANTARKRLGIRFDATAGLGHGIGDPAAREGFLAELKAGLQPMETLGCPAMIVLSGNVVEGLSREQQHAACIETLKQAARTIEGRTIDGRPVKLLLETIDPEENPKYYLTTMAECFEVVRAVNHPQVRCLYDFFHEQIAEGNLIEKLEKNIEWIDLVHIADVPGRHEPGTGEINYTSIYRTLARLHYRGTVAMEFLPTGEPVAALR
ncbi:MAG: TIM barrel protein, partial [Terracidiphilus sp.]